VAVAGAKGRGTVPGLCVHSLRTTAATNALSHEADIAKMQEWLRYCDISTTRMYDKRLSKPEDGPTFKVMLSESCEIAGSEMLARRLQHQPRVNLRFGDIINR
jgi:hypothetical protein